MENFIIGLMLGPVVVCVWLWLCQWFEAKPLPRRPYWPARYAYPVSNRQLRKSLVFNDIVTGALRVDESKKYLSDSTLTVAEWKQAVKEREDLASFEREVRPIRSWPHATDGANINPDPTYPKPPPPKPPPHQWPRR